MHKILVSLFAIIVLLGPIGEYPAAAEQTPDISGHQLKVSLFPDEKRIEAEDEVKLVLPAHGEFSFTLNKNLSISRMTSGSQTIDFESVPYKGPESGETGHTDNFNLITVHLPEGAESFVVKYYGVIYDPLEPSKALTHIRGDFTSGIISPEGVYLSPETGWYPDTPNAMATYHIEASVPPNWFAVSQGNLLEETVTNEGTNSVWDCDVPFDGCSLVANAYYKRTRNIDGVDCSTYFYRDNPQLSDSFLDKLEGYMPAYQKLFGPFPYSRFDVVENFFSTGYGMPGFTLLGSRVLTMPFATAEGSLAHEMVHCWWGNYVFPDWEKGNWCEGLTYYSTNYYWNILSGNPEKAADFRFTDMVKYTLQVHESDEYAVRKFRTKFTNVDGNIGYGKAGAIFGMLHGMLGDEQCFDSLKLVIKRQGGKKATWDDFQAAFEEVSGKDLDGFFSSWLDNKGTPKLQFDSLRQEEKYGNYRVTGSILQKGEQFNMTLPYVIKSMDGEEMGVIEIGTKSTDFAVGTDEKPVSLELDPEYYIFRRLSRDEIQPCLESTMEADSLLVVLPSGGGEDFLEVMDLSSMPPGKKKISVKAHYEELAQSILESGTKAKVKYDKDISEADLEKSSVLCLGAAKYNSLAASLADKTGDLFTFRDDSFTVDGTEYAGETQAVLITVRNPYNDNYDLTLYSGNSPQAIFKANYIFFYSLYSYVIFENGNPIKRDNWERGKGPLYIVLNSEQQM